MNIHVQIRSHWRDQTWEGTVEVADSNDPEQINELLWRFFNVVDEGDAERLYQLGYRLPSLSMNDRITWGGKTYQAVTIGWKEVNPDDPLPKPGSLE